MVVYAALQNGMWTEITRRDFERFSRWGDTVNAITGKFVLVYNQFSGDPSYDVYIEDELYAWCRPVHSRPRNQKYRVV